MSKLTIVLALAAFVYYIHANPAPGPFPHFDDADSFFDDFPMPTMRPIEMPTMRPIVIPTMAPINVENLHPDGNNSHVSGYSVSHNSSMKTVDGVVVQDTSSTSAIVNKDGDVKKYSSGSDD